MPIETWPCKRKFEPSGRLFEAIGDHVAAGYVFLWRGSAARTSAAA
jgi:hypothetical protein